MTQPTFTQPTLPATTPSSATPAKTRPPWLPTTPTSDQPKLDRCPRCATWTLRFLDGAQGGRVAALDTRADIHPLDLQAELAARIAGRATYDAVTLAGRTHLVWRDIHRLRAPRRHPVLLAHDCRRWPPPGAPAIPAPPTAGPPAPPPNTPPWERPVPPIDPTPSRLVPMSEPLLEVGGERRG